MSRSRHLETERKFEIRNLKLTISTLLLSDFLSNFEKSIYTPFIPKKIKFFIN